MMFWSIEGGSQCNVIYNVMLRYNVILWTIEGDSPIAGSSRP